MAYRDFGGSWWVGLSNRNAFTFTRWGSWTARRPWDEVQVGDFDGDGREDLMGRLEGGNGWFVSASEGTGFDTSLWAKLDQRATWIDMRHGDFNGDGVDDLFLRKEETGALWVGLSEGDEFRVDQFGAISRNIDWSSLQVGDFNGDGLSDVAVRNTGTQLAPRGTGIWYVGVSDGSGFNNPTPGGPGTLGKWGTWNSRFDWSEPLLYDVDGDGADDLIGRIKSTGQWVASLSRGTRFDTGLIGQWDDDDLLNVSVVTMPFA